MLKEKPNKNLYNYTRIKAQKHVHTYIHIYTMKRLSE